MLKHIVVVGSQRSGTTLMGQMLGSHPLSVMIDENDNLYQWTNAHFGSPRSAVNELLFKHCCKLARTKYVNSNSRYYQNGELREKVEFVVLKAPNLTYHYNALANTEPAAQIVYMFRDIRDVVTSILKLSNVPILKNQLTHIFALKELAEMFPKELSLLKRSDWIVKPHIKIALMVKIKMSLSNCFKGQGLNVIKVKYEDLVVNSEQVVPQICADAGMPYANQCQRYYEVLQGFGPGHTKRNRELDIRSIGSWKDYLTKRQASEIMEVTGDLMESMGYQ